MRTKNMMLCMALTTAIGCQNNPFNRPYRPEESKAIPPASTPKIAIERMLYQDPQKLHYGALDPGKNVELPRYSASGIMHNPDYRESFEYKVYSDANRFLGEFDEQFGWITDINGNNLVDVALIVNDGARALVYDAPGRRSNHLYIMEYDRTNSTMNKIFEYGFEGKAGSIRLSTTPKSFTVEGKGLDGNAFRKVFLPDGSSFKTIE